ncbi:SusC/RagA family TonB-linked outer membrane protein [Dysgonomonas sp. GY617]|uniref:SusC/RagA family TonB-linked outer membrane protein n=1 Tax=Dysgonomonas sp. GY617 TaxID=2780420 RepID=UPI0018831DD9|nr:TonB-dependent receptor [Dysgonomonas sp. GY617]MBF0575023.1 TonB-dependent receptor [Dysgonomonas sp. GY617]
MKITEKDFNLRKEKCYLHTIKRYSILLLMSLLIPALAFSQTKMFQGVVKDSQDEPIIGASVIVVGSKTGTVTDLDGKFSIQVSPQSRISISYIGYLRQEISVGNNFNQTIVLKEDNTQLDDVVVVGYGTQKKATLTGAVSSIDSRELTLTRNENVVNMLAGKIPGVRISQLSAQPGEFDTKIDIRGMGEPLIVVDGIPRDKDYFSRMDPSEIASVSVLKDASASIYGVRSSNGVLLITTKMGTSNPDGKFDISYSINRGWQQFLYVPNTVNAIDYMRLKNEQIRRNFDSNYMNQQPLQFSDADIQPYLDGTKKTSNYVDAAFNKTSPQVQHNLNVNGGNGKINYFLNLGYMDIEGAYKSGDLNYNRWNFRSNVDAKISDRLKVQVNLSGFMDEKNQPRTDIWAIYKQAWRQKPTVPIYVNDNPLYPNFDMIDNENPVAVIDANLTGYRKDVGRTFNGIMALTYDVPGVKGLTAKGLYSYDFKHTDKTDYKKAYYLYSYTPAEYGQNGEIIKAESYNPHLRNSPTTVRRESFPDYKTLMQLSLNYSRSFNDAHNVSGLFLYEEEYASWDSFYAQREILVASQYLSAGEDLRQLAGMYGIGERASRAWVGKFNYDYKGKYLAEFSFRNDASSKFPKDSRWGFFPAGSLGWRLSEENFIKENSSLSFINNIKLRASYGKLGDDRSAGDYPPIYVGYNLEPNDRGWIYNGVLVGGVIPTAIPNINLTWYTSKTRNFGLDFDLWNGLLGGTAEYFQRDREGLLDNAGTVIPGTVGAVLPQENLKTDRTFGVELALTHRNKIRDFSYFVNGQISTTRNQYRFNNESKAGNSYDNWRNRNTNRYADIWWGKGYGGQFTNYNQIYNHSTLTSSGTVPGDYYYEDWNGDGVINGNDDYPIATYNLPLINYGIILGGEWKGIELSFIFQGTANVYTQYTEVLASPLQFDGGALTQFLDRWHPEDRNADIFDPSTKWVSGYYPTTGSSTGEGKVTIRDASYLRLKTVEVGYSFPQKTIGRFGIKGLRVYFNGYNLLTFTGLKYTDPEHPGSAGGASSSEIDVYKYPVNKTYNIGASIKF